MCSFARTIRHPMRQPAAWLILIGAGAALGCRNEPVQPMALQASQLAFVGAVSGTAAGAVITPPVVVAAQDAAGKTVASFAGNVTVSLATNPTGGKLSGTRSVTASGGFATFPDLSIDAPGIGYTLIASATGLSEPVSMAFNIIGWTAKAPMPTLRSYFGIGVLNGVLYAVGGEAFCGLCNPNGAAPTSVVEAYVPNGWATRAPMPTVRAGLAVGVVNGLLYAVGGSATGANDLATLEAYDPLTNTWTTKAPMPTARSLLAVEVVNGILYAIGGLIQASGQRTNVVEAYDPATNSWTTKAPMPTARETLAVAVANGALFAIGGQSSLGTLATVEKYDPTTNTWSSKAPMPNARQSLAVGVVGGVVYAVGGVPTGLGFPTGLGQVEAYDPMTDTWTSKPALPTPRYGLGVGALNGVLYAIGGFTSTAYTGANEAYQP
jgi:Kelch motif